jgi:hypothetical protein
MIGLGGGDIELANSIILYCPIFGLACQGKDIVFRFIIEYSSFKGFWPLGNNK